MNRKNTAAAAMNAVVAAPRTTGLNRGFNPGPGNRIHPREGLLPVRAGARARGCSVWSAVPSGMPACLPAKRNPRSEGTREKTEETRRADARGDTRRGLLRADLSEGGRMGLVNASSRFENRRRPSR